MKKNILLITLLLTGVIFGQSKKVKFGEIPSNDLEMEVYENDIDAEAVYLFKSRKSHIIYNQSGIVLETFIHERVKVLDEEAFGYGTHRVKLYESQRGRESISGFKGQTYNLVNGKVVKVKLGKSDLMREQLNEFTEEVKFTMPQIKKGSVLEYKYVIRSPFFYQIDPIQVQYEIPVRDYYTRLTILEYLKFSKRQKGYYPFQLHESKKVNHNFNTQDIVLEIEESNIPAIEDEPFVNHMSNYITGLDIETTAWVVPDAQIYEYFSNTWKQVVKDVVGRDQFVYGMKARNFYQDDLDFDLNSSTEEKIQYGLAFVKSKVAWNKNYGKIPQEGIKDAYSKGEGNTADINLLLVSVLNALGVEAMPSLSATRSNGLPLFPTSDKLNYLMAAVNIDGEFYFFDATNPYTTLNTIPIRAINGDAFVIHDVQGNFKKVKINSSNQGSVMVMMNYVLDTEGKAQGQVRSRYADYEALLYRNNYAHVALSELEAKKINNIGDAEVSGLEIKEKSNPYKPISESYSFSLNNAAELIGDNLILNPLLFLTQDENPFKSESREFPMDFGYGRKLRYIVDIDLPDGYRVAEMPSGIAAALPDNLGKFSYRVNSSGNKIKVVFNFSLNNYLIGVDYYPLVKSYFEQMVSKNTEQIILEPSSNVSAL